MPHFVNDKDDIMQSINDITSDFAGLKVSVLKKALLISQNVDRITIGPESTMIENESKRSENIENEQNSCNIKSPPKTNYLKNNKSMQSGITFSVKKILLESEYQRKEEVQKEIERHWQQMNEKGKAIKEDMENSRSHMAKERECKSKKNYEDILAEENRAEQEEIRKRHERQEEVEEYRKRMKEKQELTKSIINLRNVFKTKYDTIFMAAQSCNDMKSASILFSSCTAKIDELFHQVGLIDEKIMTGDVATADLNTMKKAAQQMDEISCIVKVEIERINTAYQESLVNKETLKQSQLEPEILEVPKPNAVHTSTEIIALEQVDSSTIPNSESNLEDKEQQQNVQIIENTTSNIPPVTLPTVHAEETVVPTNEQNESKSDLYEYVDKESLQMYANSKQFLENYAKSYAEFLQSTSTKKFRFECQKAINIPVNAISGINRQHLYDKYERLHNLLIGQSSPNVNQYPQGTTFCKNVLAKKIVSQGETLVSSKSKMAFPIAAVIVAIWNDHPDFGDFLLSHFHDACPYIVPVFLPKMEGQSNEDYYKSMGYKYAEDGTVEKQDKFLKRMSGLMRLYASITITSQRKGVNKTNPHGLQYAWRWLAAVLNIEPRTEIVDLCATLLLDMLEVAGNALWTAYPRQFQKLLILLSDEYYSRMQAIGCVGGGPVVRFQEFLKNCLTKGFIPQPDGQLSSNFW
ncbi:gle1 RNA export mediator [Lasioglossum baleicum]|uniref:gle1 RNA export mediator n=1 Tax=Lasioglossum baleicum TaxID=434251 RepID=UPI003FCDC5BE